MDQLARPYSILQTDDVFNNDYCRRQRHRLWYGDGHCVDLWVEFWFKDFCEKRAMLFGLVTIGAACQSQRDAQLATRA